jgi:hypothetical protein
MYPRHGLIIVVCLALLGQSPAWAAVESDTVLAAISAYEQLDYDKAIDLCKRALKESLTREEQVVTRRTFAFALAAQGRLDEARQSFLGLLRMDPNYELDRTVAPRLRALFEEARRQMATAAPSSEANSGMTGALDVRVPPARDGHPLEIRVGYAGGMAQSAQLFYRTKGRLAYLEVQSKGDAKGFTMTVPGMHVHAPGLEYYVTVLDEGGVAVARAGTLTQPRVIELAAPKVPAYKKGWVWGVVVAVLAAGAGVGVGLGLTLGRGPDPNAPATVTLTASK